MSIPKIIHFCWLSGEAYPEAVVKCIDSWYEHFNGYEFILWDAKKFDVSRTKWTKEAFDQKKWAFVSDYIRFYALYKFGGVYLDSDVTILKSFDDLLSYDSFFGFESTGLVEAAVVGAAPGQSWVRHCLNWYESNSFANGKRLNLTIAPLIMQAAFEKDNSIALIDTGKARVVGNKIIFPFTSFSPKDSYTGRILSRSDTYAIHQFHSAWLEPSFLLKLKKLLHLSTIRLIGRKKHNLIFYYVRARKVHNITKVMND